MSARSELSGHFVGLVDIVFAVIVGVSLIGFFDDLKQGEPLLSFDTFVLFVSYVSVVLSWVGYHLSVARTPHTGAIGYCRFVIDLCILLAYLVLVYFFRSFGVIIFTYLTLFFLYLVWGCLKMWEHGCWGQQAPRYGWRLLSLAGAGAVALLWERGVRWEWPSPGWSVPFLLVLVACVLWYRFAPCVAPDREER